MGWIGTQQFGLDGGSIQTQLYACTVEPPNKGHVGDNINSAVVSFVESLIFLSSEVQNVLEV